MKITKRQLRRLIREALGRPPWEGERPSWADAHYRELGRQKQKLAQWKEQGVPDSVDFQSWMTELVKTAQGSTQPGALRQFQEAEPNEDSTWAMLPTDLKGYGNPETNYYDHWREAMGSLQLAKVLGATVAQHMNSDAAEPALGYY